jgi:hypothetical protein
MRVLGIYLRTDPLLKVINFALFRSQINFLEADIGCKKVVPYF